MPHGQQHCDNDGEQEWCSGDCACPLPSLMWPAQVQFPEATPYVSCVCCLILALVRQALLWVLQLNPPLKKEACVAERITLRTPEVRG